MNQAEAKPSPAGSNETPQTQLRELDERVTLIERYLDSLDEKAGEATPQAEPQPWTGRATEHDWAELADWVDWLLGTYQPTGEHHIPVCWPAHPGAAEHLAALHAAWRAAMLQQAAEPATSDASAHWHDRWLWPLLSRVRRTVPNDCVHTGHRAPQPVDLTDRGTLPGIRGRADRDAVLVRGSGVRPSGESSMPVGSDYAR